MRDVKSDEDSPKFDPFKAGGREIPELRYADDTVVLSHSTIGLEHLTNAVKKHSEEHNLYLNTQKTKIMSIDKQKRYQR